MVEMTAGRGRRRWRSYARAIVRMLCIGAVVALAGPLYAWLGIHHSGHLALLQTAPASEVLRGFDFGPVYLSKGQACRYFIAATVPGEQSAPWQTSFEVLDANKRPVFHEDQTSYIGPWQFSPGKTDHVNRFFSASAESGYYYFRFSSQSAAYTANQGPLPVVEFSVRQGVLGGWALWGPAAGLLLLGVLLIAWALALINSLGNATEQAEDPGGRLVVNATRGRNPAAQSG